jgi:hypothetical protein
MRRRLIAAVALLALAACQKTETPSAAAQGTIAAPATLASAPVAEPPVASPLPEGLAADFAYRVRSRGSEGNVHRLVIEFQGDDAATIDKKLESLLVAKGYRRYKSLQDGDALIGDYGRDGARITATTTPANGVLQLAADSRGTVYFVWNP